MKRTAATARAERRQGKPLIPGLGFMVFPSAPQSRSTRSILRRARLTPFEWVNRLPIQFHVDDKPAASLRLIQGPVEPSDVRFPVIGVFAHGIGVVHDAH